MDISDIKEKYEKKIYGYFYKYVNNIQDIENLTQELYLILIRQERKKELSGSKGNEIKKQDRSPQ